MLGQRQPKHAELSARTGGRAADIDHDILAGARHLGGNGGRSGAGCGTPLHVPVDANAAQRRIEQRYPPARLSIGLE